MEGYAAALSKNTLFEKYLKRLLKFHSFLFAIRFYVGHSIFNRVTDSYKIISLQLSFSF